ncbi:hypothetical protein KC19_2G121400 [Ceratodon purpureus]|uniref:Uncharacterized protein n=1 Tax=Ceratodon purpureus TaxID=3225 RepID=A0A8T0IUM3_CERPU|nr:hypothetical protein KC19_2G121400 [Ceratodon purpureus]
MASTAKPSTTKQLLRISLLLLCITAFVGVGAVAETPVLHRRLLQSYSNCAGGRFGAGCNQYQSCYDGKTCSAHSSCCSGYCGNSKRGGKKCCGSLGGISCSNV